MSQELLYTSAPHGLKPGSRGFCTVLSTQGMPAPLASGLEALSGYRPVFPSSDSRAHLNPVVLSHVTLPVAGRSWHVLSRIADYGLDYSQRTNKLAHHVVLDPGELTESGPAHLIGVPAFMRTEWNEEARLVPPKAVKKIPAAPVGICRAWKEVTGDAGWAGVLAESFLRDPERPVFLLYEPGQDLLPLITESISLLPPERRWDVTFSTYFTGLPQGINCIWRCLLKGSAEANQSLRFPRALRIDLTAESFDAATGGHLVEAARNGMPARFESQEQSAQSNDPAPDGAAIAKESPEDSPPDAADNSSTAATASRPPLLPGNMSKSFQLADKSSNPAPPRRRTLADVQKESAHSNRKTRLVLAVVFASIIVAAVGVGLIWTSIPLRWNKRPFAIDVAVAHNVAPQPQETPIALPPIQPAPNAEAKPPSLQPTEPKATTPAEKQQELSDPAKKDAPPKPAAAPDNNSPKQQAIATAVDHSPPPSAKPPAQSESNDKPIPEDVRKGDKIELHTLKGDSDPYSQLIFWSPPEVFLELQRKSKPAEFGEYSVNERKASPLAKIESKLDGLGFVALVLTPVVLDSSKVKRLNWCWFEIRKTPETVIRLFKPPKDISQLKTKFETQTKDGEYQLEWPLSARGSEGYIPAIRIERLALMFDKEAFEFEPALAKPNQESKRESTALLSCKTLDQRLGRHLTGDAKSELKQLQLKVTTSVAQKDGSGYGEVSVVLTLSGWNKSITSVEQNHKVRLTNIVKKVNVLLMMQNKLSPLTVPLATHDLENQMVNLSGQITKMIADIDGIDATKVKVNQEFVAKLRTELNAGKVTLDEVGADVKSLATISEHFKQSVINTAVLYYNTASVSETAIKKIYVIDFKQ